MVVDVRTGNRPRGSRSDLAAMLSGSSSRAAPRLLIACAALASAVAGAFVPLGGADVRAAAPTRAPAAATRPAAAVRRAAARHAPPTACGILAVVNSKLSPASLRLQTLTLQRLVRHRGPDGSGVHVVLSPDGERCSSVAHERLAIVDPLSGNQPLFSHDGKRSLTVNGEIYNHKDLRSELKDETPFRTESDCEVTPRCGRDMRRDVVPRSLRRARGVPRGP